MNKFTLPQTGEDDQLNEAVNLSQVTYLQKNRQQVEEEWFWCIKFGNISISWNFYSAAIRDAEFAALVGNADHEQQS